MHVCGRLLEVRRHGQYTDLMLKACKVRRLERGQPLETHPEIRTDHLWLRMETEMLEPRPAPDGIPPEMRRMFERKPLELLKLQCVAGRVGFYTDGTGALGIGVTEVIPVIRDDRVLAMVFMAHDCFLTHPWRKECLSTLERVAQQAIDCWRSEWVLSSISETRAVSRLQRLVERAQRNHRAEVKARQLEPQAGAALLTGGLDRVLGVMRAELVERGSSSVDALLRDAALEQAGRRRYGMLP
ncbi:MAG: hypothetical protein ACO289_02140 [Prochlorococcaceae cyanobacterium]